MDHIAPSTAHPISPAASPFPQPSAEARLPPPLRRPPPEVADAPVKALSERAVRIAAARPPAQADEPQAPATDIDDEIRNHPLLDMDEVPMNDTEELARLGGMNLRDENAARGGLPTPPPGRPAGASEPTS